MAVTLIENINKFVNYEVIAGYRFSAHFAYLFSIFFCNEKMGRWYPLHTFEIMK
ncbi:hypothetical protein [endosymbiont 'TC1' of Trimyema compressum]|uniref:hypothetical protein n=1 Tax=endosymbiont 'TC1' of Trimyema compressum TaxID=243899 RepID=UPI0013923E03|nr:hypothetical protein [endosymbiont 'TC1' of Trimyema compressum]